MFASLLTIPLLLLCQAFSGSAYVVVQTENGYYTAFRPNPQNLRWSTIVSPQYYLPFWQNFNPFWAQAAHHDSSDLQIVRDNQKFILDVLKCIVNEERRETCRPLLGTTPLSAQQPEMSTAAVPESTVIEMKPMDSEANTNPSEGDAAKPESIILPNQTEVMITAETTEINPPEPAPPQLQSSEASQLEPQLSPQDPQPNNGSVDSEP